MARYRIQVKIGKKWNLIRELREDNPENEFDKFILKKIAGKSEEDFPVYVSYTDHSDECCYRVIRL